MEWEAFARSIWPTEAPVDPAELRDDAESILRSTALDMQSEQTGDSRPTSRKVESGAGDNRSGIQRASSSHGTGRVASGFDVTAVVAEYRALRASVLRLWREAVPNPDLRDLNDITRFNESIDQSLTQAARSYAEEIERDRERLLANEKASRMEAEEANRAKDVFLATLSHEMRTPLNAIVGWLGILRKRDFEKERVQEGLDVIERNTQAQVQLIDDVLDVSRIVSGKLRVEIRPCELIDVINAGVNVVRPAAEARDITLNVHLDPSASGTSCDAARVQQVVWNLVSNAVKFTPKGGRVDVTLSREQSSIQIQVRDDGQGISADLLPRVFDRFRQADSSTRRQFAGLGLGLSIAKYIVEAHGGTIEAHSQDRVRGRRLRFGSPFAPCGSRQSRQMKRYQILPLVELDAATVDNISIVRLDGMRVLVVDDEADARRVLAMVLEEAGATVAAVGSADEAMKVLAGDPPRCAGQRSGYA